MRKTKSITLMDIWKESEAPIPYPLYRQICCEFNVAVIDKVLEGKDFNMGSRLGFFGIRKRVRDPRKLTVNWHETKKYKEELLAAGEQLYDKTTGKGKKFFVYYTDKFYFEFYWAKHKCTVPNKSVYRFDVTRGVKGNKEKLTALIRSNPLQVLQYKTLN